MTKINGTIEAKGIQIRATLDSNGNDYISITDIARFHDPDNPRYVIQN